MGYRDKFVTIDLDEYGEGCFVRLRNPKLRPVDDLVAKNVETGADGKPVDMEKAHLEADRVRAGLVAEWCVWDPDTDEPLPLPTREDPSPLNRLPSGIFRKIDDEISKAFPQSPPGAGS